MSLSKATSQAVPAKSGMLAPSKSHEPFAGSPPRLSPKPMASASANDIHTTPGEARQGRHSRSNSFHESQQIQLELKAGGELVFASDATGNAVLKGGTFQKLVEWILTSIGTDEKMVHNFIVSYRQWRPPMELWRILMEKHVSFADHHGRAVASLLLTLREGLMAPTRRRSGSSITASGTHSHRRLLLLLPRPPLSCTCTACLQ